MPVDFHFVLNSPWPPSEGVSLSSIVVAGKGKGVEGVCPVLSLCLLQTSLTDCRTLFRRAWLCHPHPSIPGSYCQLAKG